MKKYKITLVDEDQLRWWDFEVEAEDKSDAQDRAIKTTKLGQWHKKTLSKAERENRLSIEEA
jgi:hypothetical protein